MMVICIDISTLYKEKRGKALNLVASLASIRHENLMMIFNWWYIPDQLIFIECEPPIYESTLTDDSDVRSQQKPRGKFIFVLICSSFSVILNYLTRF